MKKYFFMRLVRQIYAKMLFCYLAFSLDNLEIEFLWGYKKFISAENFSPLYYFIFLLSSLIIVFNKKKSTVASNNINGNSLRKKIHFKHDFFNFYRKSFSNHLETIDFCWSGNFIFQCKLLVNKRALRYQLDTKFTPI